MSNENKSEVVTVKQNEIKTKKTGNPSFISKINDAVKNLKLKNIKGGKIVISLILMAVLLLMYSNIKSNNGILTSNSKQSTSENNSVNFTSGLDYIREIEKKLTDVLSSIKNAGDTKVMISINGSPELKVAENVEEKTVTTSSGTTVTVVTEPIILQVNGKDGPLVLKETLPEITGVIVVSSGAGDPKVKLDIITAVKTLLGIPSSCIEVFAGI